MLLFTYIISFIVLIGLSIIYQRYLEKQKETEERALEHTNFKEIRKFLLKDSSLAKSKKPILWIHIPHEYNSRKWLSFGSRSTDDLNQPYLYLTVKSIIKHCDNSFNICIIDDNTFARLIPNWNIDLSILGKPIVDYVRQMAMAQLIYKYGGISVPISFLCLRDLRELYDSRTRDNKMFICENVNTNITSTTDLFYPDANFMGAHKQCEILRQYIDFMQRTISTDYTSQIQFLGEFDRWCNHKIKKNIINLVSGTDVGTKTLDETTVLVDDLMSQEYINFPENMYGIWIPSDKILNRNKYEWFARMSQQQIFKGNFILAKYFVLAMIPSNADNEKTNNAKTNNTLIKEIKDKPDWVGFWRVPATNGTLNVWGQMPHGLGDNVPRKTNTGNYN